MNNFSYKAIDEIGNTISGELQADSIETAQNIIAEKGLIPSKVSAKRSMGNKASKWKGGGLFTSVKSVELILFTKLIKTMLQAGIAIVELLEVIQDQTENPVLKKIAGSMIIDIKEGASFHEAFKKYPKVFSPLYCSMVQAGEASGSLPNVLDRLIYIIAHENKIKSDIKAALRYPMMVLMFLGVAFIVLLTFVIPKFIKIFEKAGLELPVPTKICIFMHHLINDNYLIVGCITFILITGIWYYIKTEKGRLLFDSIILKIFILGPLMIKAAMSRFTSIFAILQASGVSVLDSMHILSGTIGNTAIAKQFGKVKNLLEEGRGIAEPLKAAKYFPPLVITMVAIGEESGNLDEMLQETSAHYDSEVEYAMKQLSEAIGPILTIGLAAVVCFFAISIFLPMWDLTKLAG